MSVSDRIRALKEKHKNLENALEQELKNTKVDETNVGVLKSQKLKIRDEIQRLSRDSG